MAFFLNTAEDGANVEFVGCSDVSLGKRQTVRALQISLDPRQRQHLSTQALRHEDMNNGKAKEIDLVAQGGEEREGSVAAWSNQIKA